MRLILTLAVFAVDNFYSTIKQKYVVKLLVMFSYPLLIGTIIMLFNDIEHSIDRRPITRQNSLIMTRRESVHRN